MKRLLILGCNDITKRLLMELCKDRTIATGICLASKSKQECDELKKMAESKRWSEEYCAKYQATPLAFFGADAEKYMKASQEAYLANVASKK